MATSESILISRKQTMAMLGGMSYDTFRRLLAEGTIPQGIRIGARLRWSKAALVAHLNDHSGQTTPSQ